MWDLLKLWTIAVLVTIVIAQCPPLQPPEGVVMNCADQSNATLDCTSTNITKGVLAQYRCKNGSDTDWANATMKCLCRGRWKGLEMFNNFTNTSCGTPPMILPASNLTVEGDGNDESSTQPTNSGDTSSTNGTSSETPTEPTLLKSSASDLTQGSNNSNSSSDAGNTTTTIQSDTSSNSSSSTTPSSTTGNNSSSSSSISDNSTTTPVPLDGSSSSLAANSSSDPSSTTPSSNSSDSSSSTTVSSLGSGSSALTTLPTSQDNSSSTTASSDSSSSSSATTTPTSSADNSSSSSSSDNSTTTPGSVSSNSDNSSPTTLSFSDNSSSSASSSTTVGPDGTSPSSNSTPIGNDPETRESKDLKLSASPVNMNGTTINSTSAQTGESSATTTSTPSTTTSASSSPSSGSESTPPIATVGGSLSITNSSTPSNNTSTDPVTTTPSTTSSSPTSPAPQDSSTMVSPENLGTNGSSSGTDGNSSDYQTLALTLHNKIRSNHGSQPMTLNQTLNQIAQTWAENLMNQTKLMATPGKRSYAENLFRISGGDKISEATAIESAMKAWSSSSSWYNYTNPKPTGFSQIAWNATTQLGIGLATGNDSSVVVATYYPRGNIVSVGSKADPTFYFKKNVFPEINNPVDVFPSASSSSALTTPTIGNSNNATTPAT